MVASYGPAKTDHFGPCSAAPLWNPSSASDAEGGSLRIAPAHDCSVAAVTWQGAGSRARVGVGLRQVAVCVWGHCPSPAAWQPLVRLGEGYTHSGNPKFTLSSVFQNVKMNFFGQASMEPAFKASEKGRYVIFLMGHQMCDTISLFYSSSLSFIFQQV